MRLQLPDTYNAIQNAWGDRLQMYSYWGMEVHGSTLNNTSALGYSTGTFNDTALTVFGGSGNTNPAFTVVNNAGTSTWLTVAGNGSVGIGTTNPVGALSVNSSAANALSVGISTNQANTVAQISGTLTAIASGTTGNSAVGAVATDYYNNGVSPSYSGILMDYYGSGSSGNIVGVSKANLGALIFQNGTGLIYNNGQSPIYLGFATNTTPSVTFLYTGNVGIGSMSPLVSLDLSQKTDALSLPIGTTGTRPTGYNGMIRYNSTTPAVEAYVSNVWTALGGSSSSVTLGTSATTNNPQIAGDATSGLFTPAGSAVAIATGGTERMRVTSAGAVNIASADAGLTLNGVTGIRFPSSDSTAGASIAIGSSTLAYQNAAGSAAYQNLAIGYQALSGSSLTTAATNNVALGYQAGALLTSGAANIFIGDYAGHAVTTGGNNTVISTGTCYGNCGGLGAASTNNLIIGGNGSNNFGNDNIVLSMVQNRGNASQSVLIGNGILNAASYPGAANAVVMGYYAMGNGGVGANNTVTLGYFAMNNASGSIYGDIAIGSSALNNVSGNYNIAIGPSTGSSITSGASNLVLGPFVGSVTLSSGSSNILIGTSSGVDTPSTSTSNWLNIGNTLYGDLANHRLAIGNGITSINNGTALDLSSNTTSSNSSLILPVGTTGTRPTGVNGMIRYNSTTPTVEAYVNNAWASLGGGSGSSVNIGSSLTAANPQITGDATSGLYTPAGSTVSIITGGTQRLTVSPLGSTGIGTSSPAYSLQIAGVSGAPSSTGGSFAIGNPGGTSVGGIAMGYYAINYNWIQSYTGLPLYINPLGTNLLSLQASGGAVGIGTTIVYGNANLQVDGNGNTSTNLPAGIFVNDNSTANGAPMVRVRGNRSDGNGSQAFAGGVALEHVYTAAAVASGQTLGSIYFGGNYDTVPDMAYAASISGIADGAFTGVGTAPSALVFYTGVTSNGLTVANASSGTEHMRLTSAGYLGVGSGVTSPTALLDVENNGTGIPLAIKFSNNPTGAYPATAFGGGIGNNFSGGSGEVDFWNQYTSAAMSFRFYQMTGTGAASVLMAIGTTGGVGIGATYSTITAPTGGLIVQGNVGIGSTIPAYNLDDSGTLRAAGLATIGANINMANASANVIYYGGTGVAAPASNSAGEKIQLFGTTGSVSSGDYALGIESSYLWNNSAGGYKWYESGSLKMMMDTSGNLGIGSSIPAYKLDVAGNINVSAASSHMIGGVAQLAIPYSGADTSSIAVGANALINENSSANNNVAVGKNAMQNTTSAGGNVAVGAGALAADTTGGSSVAIGASAIPIGTNSFYNTVVGAYSGSNISNGANQNVVIGALAFQFPTTASYNTAVGQNAMQGVSGTPLTGSFNVAIGISSLLNSQGNSYNNVSIGGNAGQYVTTGYQNTIVGAGAGAAITTGANNILIGNSVNTPTSANVSNTLNIGNAIYGTGMYGTPAISIGTTSVGDMLSVYSAGEAASFGNSFNADTYINLAGSRAFVGYETSKSYSGTGGLVLQGGNVGGNAKDIEFIVGTAAFVGATPAMTLTGSGLLGIGTTSPYTTLNVRGTSGPYGGNGNDGIIQLSEATGNDRLEEGIVDGSYAWLQAVSPGVSTRNLVLQPAGNGYVGVGTTSLSYMLHVNGTAYATGAAGALSDIRHKKNVEPLADDTLDVIRKLRPVSYYWKEPKDDGMQGRQYGFIAQEVQKVLPDAVLTMNNDEKTLGLKYDDIIPILTKAVQEQDKHIQTTNDDVQQKLAALQARLDAKSVDGKPTSTTSKPAFFSPITIWFAGGIVLVLIAGMGSLAVMLVRTRRELGALRNAVLKDRE
jgi:hypothetical protein